MGNKPRGTLNLDEKDKILGIVKTAIESFFNNLTISLIKRSGCLKCSRTSRHKIKSTELFCKGIFLFSKSSLKILLQLFLFNSITLSDMSIAKILLHFFFF